MDLSSRTRSHPYEAVYVLSKFLQAGLPHEMMPRRICSPYQGHEPAAKMFILLLFDRSNKQFAAPDEDAFTVDGR